MSCLFKLPDKVCLLKEQHYQYIIYIYIYIFFPTLVNFKQSVLSKTRSLDYVIQECSLAQPSWVINHYTMLYKVFLYIVAFCLLLQTKFDIYLYFFRHFSPNNNPLALVGHEMIIANLVLTGLVGYLSSHMRCAHMK